MQLWKLMLLAIIQGLTEILPISSSGHLILFKEILQIEYNGLDFEIFLHFGSLIAVIIYYKKEITYLIKDSFLYLIKKEKHQYKTSFNLLLCLLTSTLLTGIFGLLFNKLIETYFTSICILPFSFLLTSLILFLSSKINNESNLNYINIKNALLIGFFQTLALIPGISRSGSTILGCKISKLNNSSSMKYSYLLFIPITLGSFILKIHQFIQNPVLIFPFSYYIVCLIIVIILTFISLNFFTKRVNNKIIHLFSYYLLLLSIFIVCYYFI